jgi:hypothetical protein
MRLVEVWRRIAPEDATILGTLTAAAEHDPAVLQRWFEETTDCQAKAHLVEILQESNPSDPYTEMARAALACDAENATARRAVAVSSYRRAVQAWNALAEDPPQDLDDAAPRIENVRALLKESGDLEGVAALGEKIDAYEDALTANDRQEAAARQAEAKKRCLDLLGRARWARDTPRVGLADLADIIRRTSDQSKSCSARLEAGERQELADIASVLGERLEKDCDAEYYRLPDLPTDLKTLREDQIDTMHSQVTTFETSCSAVVANSFRAEKVANLLQKLESAAADR